MSWKDYALGGAWCVFGVGCRRAVPGAQGRVAFRDRVSLEGLVVGRYLALRMAWRLVPDVPVGPVAGV